MGSRRLTHICARTHGLSHPASVLKMTLWCELLWAQGVDGSLGWELKLPDGSTVMEDGLLSALDQQLLSTVTSFYPFNKNRSAIISIKPVVFVSVYITWSNVFNRTFVHHEGLLHSDLELPLRGGIPKVHKLSRWPCCTLWRATTSQGRTHKPGPNPSAWLRFPSCQRAPRAGDAASLSLLFLPPVDPFLWN